MEVLVRSRTPLCQSSILYRISLKHSRKKTQDASLKHSGTKSPRQPCQVSNIPVPSVEHSRAKSQLLPYPVSKASVCKTSDVPIVTLKHLHVNSQTFPSQVKHSFVAHPRAWVYEGETAPWDGAGQVYLESQWNIQCLQPPEVCDRFQREGGRKKKKPTHSHVTSFRGETSPSFPPSLPPVMFRQYLSKVVFDRYFFHLKMWRVWSVPSWFLWDVHAATQPTHPSKTFPFISDILMKIVNVFLAA